MAYLASSPAKLVARIAKPPVDCGANAPDEAGGDRPDEDAARAQGAGAHAKDLSRAAGDRARRCSSARRCGASGKRGFALLYDYGKGLIASFWVGIERQGPLEMDPRISIPAYLGHNGWIALDLDKGASERELAAIHH